jgi:hypothetical protein
MASQGMIRLFFRDAATRRSCVRSVVQDSCFGYGRFHSFNTTRMVPFLFPGFRKEDGKSTSPHGGRTIKGEFLGI